MSQLPKTSEYISPDIEQIVTYSTTHITRLDDELLRRDAQNGDERLRDVRGFQPICLVVFEYDTGFFVRLSADNFGDADDTEAEMCEYGYSEMLIALLRCVCQRDIFWVRIDANGPVVDGLPVFDW